MIAARIWSRGRCRRRRVRARAIRVERRLELIDIVVVEGQGGVVRVPGGAQRQFGVELHDICTVRSAIKHAIDSEDSVARSARVDLRIRVAVIECRIRSGRFFRLGVVVPN